MEIQLSEEAFYRKNKVNKNKIMTFNDDSDMINQKIPWNFR